MAVGQLRPAAMRALGELRLCHSVHQHRQLNPRPGSRVQGKGHCLRAPCGQPRSVAASLPRPPTSLLASEDLCATTDRENPASASNGLCAGTSQNGAGQPASEDLCAATDTDTAVLGSQDLFSSIDEDESEPEYNGYESTYEEFEIPQGYIWGDEDDLPPVPFLPPGAPLDTSYPKAYASVIANVKFGWAVGLESQEANAAAEVALQEVIAAAGQPPVELQSDVKPDFELPAPPGGARILLFGCVHADPDSPHIARFILQQRPHTVVVETAATRWHGDETGRTLTRDDALWGQRSSQRCRGWAQLGVQLASWAEGKEPASLSPLDSPLWQELTTGPKRLWSEWLVYVAAFAANSLLIHGDRPKRVTYHRLLWVPSVEDLDAAYGMQSALNYHEMVSTLRPFNDVGNTNCAHRVLFLERDATLLLTLHEASLSAGPGRCIVGVVGASHLAGMRHLWATGRWLELLNGGEALEMPDIDALKQQESAERQAVRWALFRAVLRLICRPDVLRDVRNVVGPAPRELRQAYGIAAELYGSTRMLLAVLDRDQLAEVCQGWRCDMYEVLEPLRAARPVNGGSGIDEELVLYLRTLQFELGAPQ
ncbi:hypothetical protein N2152v2_009487 [Parachlorella kessleri]